MSNSLRKLKRQKDRDSDELPPVEQKLPTGRVLTEPIKGTFVSFPLLGWIAVRDRDRIPLVMLVLALLEPGKEEMGVPKGTLEVELPLYVDTEAPTIAALERYGWTGLTWTVGAPPPFDSWNLAEQLTALLEPSLRSTLIFASDPQTGGQPAQNVEVMRAKGRFLMPPLEVPAESPKPERVRALRDLVLSYRSFYPEGTQATEGGLEP